MNQKIKNFFASPMFWAFMVIISIYYLDMRLGTALYASKPQKLGSPITQVTSATNSNATCTPAGTSLVSANSDRSFLSVSNTSSGSQPTIYICLASTCSPASGIAVPINTSWTMPYSTPYFGNVTCTTSPSTSSAFAEFSVNN